MSGSSAESQNGEKSVPLTLQIRLHESNDEHADQNRLRETMRIVRENPGQNLAFLSVTSAGERVILQLPNCDASWAVVDQLKRHLAENGDAEVTSTPATASLSPS